MNHLIGVLIPVWIATTAWFVGAIARAWGGVQSERVLAWSWFWGSVAMWVHIAGSYAFAYHWSHAAALLATAEESERVTGIRAGWGVYVNFCFAATWSLYSIRLVRGKTWNHLTHWLVSFFTAGIVLMATLVFESGPVRYASALGFTTLGLLIFQKILIHRESPANLPGR